MTILCNDTYHALYVEPLDYTVDSLWGDDSASMHHWILS